MIPKGACLRDVLSEIEGSLTRALHKLSRGGRQRGIEGSDIPLIEIPEPMSALRVRYEESALTLKFGVRSLPLAGQV